MITLIAFVVLFGLGVAVVKLAAFVNRAVRSAGAHQSVTVTRSA